MRSLIITVEVRGIVWRICKEAGCQALTVPNDVSANQNVTVDELKCMVSCVD